jgi:uncharacterized protein
LAHPNEELLREGFAAFSRGDMEALRRQYFAEDIRYHFPGRSPIAGDYEGIAQVLDFFRRNFEGTGGTLRLELHDLLANDDHAVALFTVRAEREGRQLDQQYVQVFHVRDGRATEAWTHPADLYAVDEFWS